MQIAVTFTQDELRLIARALTFGIIHTDKDDEEQRMKELEQKINMLGSIQQGK
jgi:hypothetical protein